MTGPRPADARVLLVAGVVVLLASAAVLAGAGGVLNEPAESSSATELRFAEVAEERGFEYRRNRSGKYATTGRSGVYVTDFDGDGWPDLLAIGGSRPVLFENTGGAFERTRAFAVGNRTIKSALFFDHDNDGRDDLLLLPVDDHPLFYENRGGRFVRHDVGLASVHLTVPTAASAADYDGDGCLDLFVSQNGEWGDRLPRREQMVADARGDVSGSNVFVEEDNGGRNLLLRGTCGSFENVTAEAGIRGRRWTTTASFVDLTGDGLPDVHAANDFNFDYLYVNRGDGTFEPRRIGETNRHAMSSEVADFDGDGHPDLFVTNIHFDHSILLDRALKGLDNSGNNLLINRGNGTFASREEEYGVVDGGWGWAAVAVDLNNDGDRDIVHATQYYLNETISDLEKSPPRAWERGPDGFVRQNASAVGLVPTNGLGVAHLDYDRDGDQDIAIANRAGEFRLFENRAEGGHWLQVRVAGGPEVPAIGAEVVVTAGDGEKYAVNNARVDFLSQDTRVLHFGLASADPVTVRVIWPDGRERTFRDVAVDRRIVLPRRGEPRNATAE